MGLMASKDELIITAIESHDIDLIKTLISDLSDAQKADICKLCVTKNTNHCTILHYATWQNNPELLKLFVDVSDDLEVRDGLGWTPLMTAVHRDSKDNVKLLLKHGAKIDCDSVNGMHLIAVAMSFHNIELIEILMDYGAQVTLTPDTNINEENSTGCYLLHFAVDDGLTEIAKLLIDRGKMPINMLDHHGWSPLHLAAGHNYLDSLKLLIKNGADVNIKDHHGNTPLAWAKEMNAEDVISELDKHNATADEEWHGDKLKLNNYKDEDETNYKSNRFINSQFEIEDPNPNRKIDDKKRILLDGLQRQC